MKIPSGLRLTTDEAVAKIAAGARIGPVYDHGGFLFSWKIDGFKPLTAADMARYERNQLCQGYMEIITKSMPQELAGA